jgi:hypothetical protein
MEFAVVTDLHDRQGSRNLNVFVVLQINCLEERRNGPYFYEGNGIPAGIEPRATALQKTNINHSSCEFRCDVMDCIFGNVMRKEESINLGAHLADQTG